MVPLVPARLLRSGPLQGVWILGLLFVLVLPGLLRAGPALRRPWASRVDFLDEWIRFARRKRLLGVVLEEGLRKRPGEVPESWMARTGVILAVRSRAPESERPPPAPDLSRVLYFREFPPRGPDQIPLPGQFFLERWVAAGGAALSTFSSRERFAYVADEPAPLGDVLFALAFVVARPHRMLSSAGEILHLATQRGGRRQDLSGLRADPATHSPWSLEPDRRPLIEVLAADAARSGRHLVVDEPLAGLSVWAGGRAYPGAFTLAACQSLRIGVARKEPVLGLAAGRLVTPVDPLGEPGSPWSRQGFVRPRELLPAGWWAPRERRVWVSLRGAPRDLVRGVAAWVTRARRLEQGP